MIEIKLDISDVADYVNEDEIREIVIDKVKQKLSVAYNNEINKLTEMYLGFTMREFTKELFLKDKTLEEDLKETLKKRIKNLETYHIFYKKGDYEKEDSPAISYMKNFFSIEENKKIFDDKLKEKMQSRIESLDMEDFAIDIGYKIGDYLKALVVGENK